MEIGLGNFSTMNFFMVELECFVETKREKERESTDFKQLEQSLTTFVQRLERERLKNDIV